MRTVSDRIASELDHLHSLRGTCGRQRRHIFAA
jgi:hypothetical protein